MKSGWQTKRLGDVALVSTGPFGSLLHKSDYTNNGVPLVNPINIQGERIIPDLEKSINELTKRRLSSYILEDGDVVVGRRGEIGRCAVVGHREAGWICGTGSFFVRPSSFIDSHFLAHLLRSSRYRAKLEAASTGATMSNLSNQVVGNLVVALPSLAEQERIVTILDDAFERIGAAVTNAGKNLANAGELFNSYLDSVFARPKKGWVRKELGDVASFKNGLNFTKGSKGELVKIVGVKDFQKNFYVPTGQLETAQIDGSLSADYELRVGDILTVRSNGNKQLIGRCILADNVPEKTSHSGFTIRIRVASKEVSPPYLVHFLKSKASREMLIESGDGANISSLNQQALSALPVTLPPFADQLAITERIEAIAAETKSLEAIYQQKLGYLAELKQAILQKAVAGDLTGQPGHDLQAAAE